MIKYIFLFCTGAILLYGCNDDTLRNSEDNKSEMSAFIDAQPGFYKGTFPCKDCEGILTLLELKDDSSAVLFETYEGKEEIPYATFGTWSSLNESVTFSSADDERMYKATAEGLILSDSLESENKNYMGKYKLTIDLSKPFIVEGRYFYMADAHIFTFIGDEKVYPILTNQENLKIEKQFMNLSEEEQKCFCIQIKGQIVEAEDMEGRVREHLEIIEYLGLIEKSCTKNTN